MIMKPRRILRKHINPEDWHLFKHEFVSTLKGYDVFKVGKLYFIQVKSGEYFGYTSIKQLEQTLEILPKKG